MAEHELLAYVGAQHELFSSVVALFGHGDVAATKPAKPELALDHRSITDSFTPKLCINSNTGIG